MSLEDEIQVYLATRQAQAHLNRARQLQLTDAVVAMHAALVQMADCWAKADGHTDLPTRMRYYDTFHDHITAAVESALSDLGH